MALMSTSMLNKPVKKISNNLVYDQKKDSVLVNHQKIGNDILVSSPKYMAEAHMSDFVNPGIKFGRKTRSTAGDCNKELVGSSSKSRQLLLQFNGNFKKNSSIEEKNNDNLENSTNRSGFNDRAATANGTDGNNLGTSNNNKVILVID
ncbi:hypothetical protein BY996DRAFT_6428295 [Phakopsora pachyrhizi]|nr:hypothetical protein BY996DRAFT_6428295 [Phakopsora pachyrhizi]